VLLLKFLVVIQKENLEKKNDGLDPKKFVVEQDSASGCEYTISFPAIEDGCPGSGRGSSWGWITVGILVGVFIIYFGAGVAFRMKKLGAQGKDAIPHLEFWESLPSLIMDGVRFSIDQTKITVEKIRSNRS